MDTDYGIFTTDGDAVAGTFTDESAAYLAERLDESTAYLFISTKNGAFLMGTAVNVQKKGRRPDTVIYLESAPWDISLPPRIDLSYISDFYARVRETLEANDYEVRAIGPEPGFLEARAGCRTTGMSGSETVDYTIGRLLMGKSTAAVSQNPSKSVDFTVAVTEKLREYMSAGFTIAASERAFRGADLTVVTKYSGESQIDLDTETIAPGNIDIYREIGIFAQKVMYRKKFTGREPLNKITDQIADDFRKNPQLSEDAKDKFTKFMMKESVGSSHSKKTFSKEDYDETAKQSGRINESGYDNKWKVNSYDRMKLDEGYAKIQERKKKSVMKIIGAFLIIVLILAAVFVIADPLNIGFFKGTPQGSVVTSGNGTITMSAIPEDPEGNFTYSIEIVGMPDYDIPPDFVWAGKVYNVVLESPSRVELPLANMHEGKSYLLLKYDLYKGYWLYEENTIIPVESDGKAAVRENGVYGLFYRK